MVTRIEKNSLLTKLKNPLKDGAVERICDYFYSSTRANCNQKALLEIE